MSRTTFSGPVASKDGFISSAPTGTGIGYSTGAGGVVTQLTSRSTGVTLSKLSGTITGRADSLAALTIATFTVTNTTVAITDTIVLSKVSGDADAACYVNAVAAGSFQISVINQHATVADTTAMVMNFAVIKAVSA